MKLEINTILCLEMILEQIKACINSQSSVDCKAVVGKREAWQDETCSTSFTTDSGKDCVASSSRNCLQRQLQSSKETKHASL